MKKTSLYFFVRAIRILIIVAFLFSGAYAADVTLSWNNPSGNEDGSPLTDLGGFRVYYGTQSRVYNQPFGQGIDAGNAASYVVQNLSNNSTYYFAVTAYDINGNESTYSAEQSVFIPPLTVADIQVNDSVSPSGDLQIPFGTVTGGTTSQQTVTVTNAGNADLVIGSIAVGNPLVSPFSIVNNYCSGQTIPPASNCMLAVRFAPSAAGTYSDSFNVPSNDPDESNVTLNVSGTGEAVPLPDVSVTDSVAPGGDLQIPFGTVTTGTTSQQTVTVTNAGNADLVIGSIAGSNPLASPFSIVGNTCSGQTVPPASNCTLTVRFTPSAAGTYNDSFNIPSNDPDESSVTLNISGTGGAVTLPDVSVSDSVAPGGDLQIPFGTVTAGTTSQQTVTVTNAGNADLVIGSIAGSNPLASPFSIAGNTCSGQTVLPASNCTLTVRFTPSAAGTYNDSFNIPSNDPDESSVTLNVSGTGEAIPLPDVSVTDSVAPADDLQIPFGDLTGGFSSDHTVSIYNSGNADLAIGSVAYTNPLSEPFSIVDNTCSGQTVPPASNCTLTVRFKPSAAGTYNDSFNIPSNDPDETAVTISVSGTGLAADVNNAPSDPILVYPAAGQKGLGRKVGFKWKKSKDPDGDLVTYDIQVCQDPDMTTGCISDVNLVAQGQNDIVYAGLLFSPLPFLFVLIIMALCGTRIKNWTRLFPVIILLTAMILVSCGGGGTGSGGAVVSSQSTSGTVDNMSYEVSGLNSTTTYYWTITARDGNGGETTSEVRSFETE